MTELDTSCLRPEEEEQKENAVLEEADAIKARKRSWKEAEEQIVREGGTALLSCDFCRTTHRSYNAWKRHQCLLKVSQEPVTHLYRVVTLQEEKEMKQALFFTSPWTQMRVCAAARVCLPGVFPLIFLPTGRWTNCSLGWLGQEVGCTVKPRAVWEGVQKEGIRRKEPAGSGRRLPGRPEAGVHQGHTGSGSRASTTRGGGGTTVPSLITCQGLGR